MQGVEKYITKLKQKVKKKNLKAKSIFSYPNTALYG